MPSAPVRPRVLIDTNVLVSATIAGGRPGRVFELAVEDKLELVTTPGIMAELAGVLTNKVKGADADIERLMRFLLHQSTIVRPEEILDRTGGEQVDNEILAAAVEGGVDYLVSGDRRHILSLGEVEGVPTVSPSEFLVIFGDR